MSAYVDTNVLVRHITGDQPDGARRAAIALHGTRSLLLETLVFLETAHVLTVTYGYARERVLQCLRDVLTLPAIVADIDLLTTALEIHAEHRIELPDAVLAATALLDGPPSVASFDRGLDRVPGLERVAP